MLVRRSLDPSPAAVQFTVSAGLTGQQLQNNITRALPLAPGSGGQELCAMVGCLAGMLSTLQDMLTEEKDAQVVANCMSVLQQVTLCPHSDLRCGIKTQQ